MYDIAKECLTAKPKLVFKSDQKKCDKWMNDSCFKAKKEFEQGKREFLKFPNNMGRRLIYMNIKKKIQGNPIFNWKGFQRKEFTQNSRTNK